MQATILTTVIISTLSADPATTSAPSMPAPADFGDVATYSLAGSLALAQQTYQHQDLGDSQFVSASLATEVDYFVAPNLALHVRGQAWFQGGEGLSGIGFGPGLGIGYYAPLAKNFGIFPKVMTVYRYSRSRSAVDNVSGADSDYTSHTIDVAVELPLVARLGQLFVGVGPRFRKQVFGRARYDGRAESYATGGFTTFEFSTRVGGWFD